MLLGCILIYLGNTGILFNCSGILITAITGAEGFEKSSLSLFYTIRSLSSAALSMPITFLLRKLPMGRWLPLALLCPALAYALMAIYTQPWHWYLSAVLASVGISASLLVVSDVINNWFYSKSATAMGICMASGGLGGALFSPVLAELLAVFSWRTTTLIMSVLSFLLMEVAACLILVRSPAACGMEPYREPEARRQTAPLREVFPLRCGAAGKILVIFLSVIPGSMFVQITNYLTQFSTELGWDLAFGAALTTMVMLGNTGFKFLMGRICDRLGVWWSLMLCYGVLAVTFLLFLLGSTSPLLLMMGALFLGIAYSIPVSSAPMCRMAFSRETFAAYYGRFSTLNSFGGACMVYLTSLILGAENGFQLLFRISMGGCVVMLVFVAWLRRLSQKRSAEGQKEETMKLFDLFRKPKPRDPEPVIPAPAEPAPRLAPGCAGELKLYTVPPRTAARLMAIVAYTLEKPLNELRFISIKEVKEV